MAEGLSSASVTGARTSSVRDARSRCQQLKVDCTGTGERPQTLAGRSNPRDLLREAVAAHPCHFRGGHGAAWRPRHPAPARASGHRNAREPASDVAHEPVAVGGCDSMARTFSASPSSNSSPHEATIPVSQRPHGSAPSRARRWPTSRRSPASCHPRDQGHDRLRGRRQQRCAIRCCSWPRAVLGIEAPHRNARERIARRCASATPSGGAGGGERRGACSGASTPPRP